jgi:AraC-like DNA-binding protein
MSGPKPLAVGFTVSADLLRGLIDCATQCGVPRERLADLIQDGDGAGGPPPVRYAGEYVLKFWERVLRITEDPIIGFRMAFFSGPKTFGVLGQIAPRCANMLEVYRQTVRYSALASNGARVSLASRSDTFSLTIDLANTLPPLPGRTIMLWGLTNLAFLPERVAFTSMRPTAMTCEFSSPGPAALRAIREHFPFEFGAAKSEVVFDRRVGELIVPTADAELKTLLAETMDRHLSVLGTTANFEQSMLTLLRGMMNGNMPTLASLSARAGMSQRTLQRRLGEANTSFQRLLNKVLKEQADELLKRGNLSQGEIAFLLGYSEVSAFSRAYHGWTGHPPGAVQA